jgi:hypothetical protein
MSKPKPSGRSTTNVSDIAADAAGSRGARDALGDVNLPSRNVGSPDSFPNVAPGGRARGDPVPITNTELQQTPIAKNAQALQNAPTPEVQAKAAQPNVQNAARTNATKLAKLGLTGALGVGALMILTGESNPAAAIEKAIQTAQETAEAAREAAGAGLNIFKNLTEFFSKYGLYVCLASSCCILIIVVMYVMS